MFSGPGPRILESLLLRTLLGLQEGSICQEVAQQWRGFYRAFEDVYNKPKETSAEKKARMTALRDLELPELTTIDYFRKL